MASESKDHKLFASSNISSDPLAKYLWNNSITFRIHPALLELREATFKAAGGRAVMLTSPDEIQFLQLLVRSIGARRALEVGCFTGFSALAIALALPPEGRVISLDIDPKWPTFGQPFWEKAGVKNKIDLRIAPATNSLKNLLESGEAGSFDYVYIDADKPSYPTYYDLCLQLVRPGGLIAFDNMFLMGHVLNEADTSPETEAMRSFTRQLSADKRIDFSLIPISDGLGLARKL